MLLFDRVLAHAVEHCSTPRDRSMLAVLRRAHIFELSAIIPLCSDWERERISPIPKRPPVMPMWAEWQYTETGEWTTVWRLGCLVQWADPADLQDIPLREGETIEHETLAQVMGGHGATRADFWTCDEFYAAQMFVYCERDDRGCAMLRTLTVNLGTVLFGLREQATVVRTSLLVPSAAQLAAGCVPGGCSPEFLDTFGTFRLPMGMHFYGGQYPQVQIPWPLFMACALLHCKNIGTETVRPPVPLSKKRQRQGKPPLATYKTLVIHATEPAGQSPGPTAGVAQVTGPTMRLHLCRGHFKYLKHDRFLNKGWHWWPAHWRGDPALGVISKKYTLTP